jgi:hypothetical protein
MKGFWIYGLQVGEPQGGGFIFQIADTDTKQREASSARASGCIMDEEELNTVVVSLYWSKVKSHSEH